MDSRAVIRQTEAGNTQPCAGPGCENWVKYEARKKSKRIVANVYENGKWNRVEHWHPECYDAAGQPYGEPQIAPQRVSA